MRNVVLAAIVLALAIAAIEKSGTSTSSGTSSAGSGASMSSNGFLAAQHKYDTAWGDHATDAQLMSVGTTICSLHNRGMSDLQVLTTTAGYQPPVGSKARSLGMQRIADARRYLCP